MEYLRVVCIIEKFSLIKFLGPLSMPVVGGVVPTLRLNDFNGNLFACGNELCGLEVFFNLPSSGVYSTHCFCAYCLLLGRFKIGSVLLLFDLTILFPCKKDGYEPKLKDSNSLLCPSYAYGLYIQMWLVHLCMTKRS